MFLKGGKILPPPLLKQILHIMPSISIDQPCIKCHGVPLKLVYESMSLIYSICTPAGVLICGC